MRSSILLAAAVLLASNAAWAQPVDPPADPPPADPPPADPAPPADPPAPADPPPADPPPADPAAPEQPAPAPADPAPPAEPEEPTADPATAVQPTAAPGATATPAPPAQTDEGWSYKKYYDGKMEELLQYDRAWGLSASLPEGVLKLRYDVNPAKANQFFDDRGRRVNLLPDITGLENILADGDSLTIFPIVRGKGTGHTFQVAYGISDPLDVFVEVPFTKVNSRLRLEGEYTNPDGETTRVNSVLRAGIIENIEANGRPRPGERYKGKMDIGDVIAGASWNFHRTKTFSAQAVAKVLFPTGTQADPNNDVTFLLGPEIDRGVGAWQVSFAHVFDWRPIEFLTYNLELATTYRFTYERNSPRWLPITACNRVPDDDPRRAQLCSGPLDPAFDALGNEEQREFFPDLSNLNPKYEVEPGLAFEITTGFIIEPGIPIPFQIAYNFQHEEAPLVKAKSTNAEEEVAGAEFERLVDTLALFEPVTLHNIGAGFQLPLFPAYVPLAVSVQGTWAIAGKNTIILERNVLIAVEGFFPIGDLWMD